jgi:single-stranded-DNA-specific exonuclease
VGTEAAIEKAKEYEEDKVLVIFLPDVNESVAGIIAGRVREATGKPSFVIVRGAESAKGSGRSIEAYSMYEEMHKCEHLLLKYGGHPMAAGLSLEEENIDEFRRLLNENTTLSKEDLIEKVYLDAQMSLSYITEKLISEINRLEPYGNKNEKPIFGALNIPVISAKQIGSEGQYLRFVLRLENGGTITALSFRNCDEQKERIIEKYGENAFSDMLKGRPTDIRLTFTFFPSLNDFNGRVSVQIMIQDIL